MDGFLGFRSSFMLDVVAVAMMGIVPVMVFSIWSVRRKRYAAHKRLQVATAAVLLVALIGFEVEMRTVGWRHLAEPSPLSQPGMWNDAVEWTLLAHLLVAIPTTFIWGFVVWRALRRFPRPVAPSNHSESHRFWGRLAAASMTMTAITGLTFYYLAFVMT